jgi:hypothetical protein
VAFERLFFDPRLAVLAVPPDLDEVVAAGAGKAFDDGCLGGAGCLAGGGLGLGGDEGAGDDGGGPGDGVAPDGVGVEDIGVPLAVVCKLSGVRVMEGRKGMRTTDS